MMSWRHLCEGFIRTFSGVYEVLPAPFNQEGGGVSTKKGRGQINDDVFMNSHKFGIIDFKAIIKKPIQIYKERFLVILKMCC